ncbi:MAG: cytidine/deoxycytidylate deaminase family protein [archaeon]
MTEKRPSWDEYFMNLAEQVGKRGTCDRGRCGAVLVKNKLIVSTGYVGAPAGFPHCDEEGHKINTVVHEDSVESKHCVRTVHAEQNAMCTAAKFGLSIDGSTLYTLMTPCRACAMMLINAGIKRVVCKKRYHWSAEPDAILKNGNVEIDYFSNELMEYSDQK